MTNSLITHDYQESTVLWFNSQSFFTSVLKIMVHLIMYGIMYSVKYSIAVDEMPYS